MLVYIRYTVDYLSNVAGIMKRILIVDSSFRWGGINVALQNLLRYIDSDLVQVDLFVMVHSGNYENEISNCRLLPKNFLIDCLMDHVYMKRGLIKIIAVCIKLINKVTGATFQHWLYGVVGNKLVSRNEYDAVIGWHEGAPTIFVSHIKHRNKIAWVHCNYANYSEKPSELKYYSTFQSIVNVAKSIKPLTEAMFPDCAK